MLRVSFPGSPALAHILLLCCCLYFSTCVLVGPVSGRELTTQVTTGRSQQQKNGTNATRSNLCQCMEYWSCAARYVTINMNLFSLQNLPKTPLTSGMDNHTAIVEYLKRKFVVSLITNVSPIIHYWRDFSPGGNSVDYHPKLQKGQKMAALQVQRSRLKVSQP